MKIKEWAKKAGVRAVKTVAQTAVAMIGASAVMSDVNWTMVASVAVLAGILSMLTSVAGIPELTEEISQDELESDVAGEIAEVEIEEDIATIEE